MKVEKGKRVAPLVLQNEIFRLLKIEFFSAIFRNSQFVIRPFLNQKTNSTTHNLPQGSKQTKEQMP